MYNMVQLVVRLAILMVFISNFLTFLITANFAYTKGRKDVNMEIAKEKCLKTLQSKGIDDSDVSSILCKVEK